MAQNQSPDDSDKNDNDNDVDGEIVNIASLTAASNGTATQNGNTIDYTANDDYCGADSFSYSVVGGNTVGVDITINCVNDQPAFALNKKITVGIDQLGSIGPQLVACQFDFGPDDEDGNQAVADFVVNIASDPAGILTAVDVQNDGQMTYGFTNNQGVATVEVQLRDNGGVDFGGVDTSTTQTITIHVQDFVFTDGFEGLICQGN